MNCPDPPRQRTRGDRLWVMLDANGPGVVD